MKAELRCKDHYQGDKCRLALGHESPWCQGAYHSWREIQPASELEPREVELWP